MPLTLATRRRRYERGYVFITTLFAVLMVLTNIIGTKLFALFSHWLPGGFAALSGYGPVILTTGLITYPLTFLFTDIASEIYGSRRATMMVTMGFVSSLLMLSVVQMAIAVTPADRYWADASHQYKYQSTVTAALSAGAEYTEVELSHREHLAQDHGATASLVAALPTQGEMFFALCSEITTSTVDAENPRSYKKITARIAGAMVQLGDIILPAVQVVEFSARNTPPRIRIANGQMLPAQGVLRDATGWEYSFIQESSSSWLSIGMIKKPEEKYPAPVDTWPEALPMQESLLAVVNVFTQIDMQAAMSASHASSGILLAASMCAYLVAQYLDVFLYHFFKRKTGGKMLWLRNNGSTWGSQFVDTIIVNSIFLPLVFGMTWSQTWSVVVCVYIVKLVLAALDTPLIYLGVYYCKIRLGFQMHEDVPDLLSDQCET